MIKSILGGKSKNLCDVAYLLTLPLDKTLEGRGFLRVLINAKPNTTYTFSRQTANQINIGSTYLVISAYDDHLHNHWLNHDLNLQSCNKSVTLTTNSDGKLWIMFSGDVYSYWQNNINPFGYIQLEKGSTATEYVPHELTSYKSIMKVSDVCQLANSKLFTPMNGDTVISVGVSVTKNIESGTITFNGTSIDKYWYHVHDYYSELRYTNLIKGYKYYISGMPVNDLGVVFQLTYLYDLQGEQIFTAPMTSNGTGAFDIYIPKGVTLTDFVVTPQLFNLTEMFGAGNEPKTVAEFKSKFPNDYYPYSPSCFVTSFDERIICNSKDGNKYV